VYERGTIFNYYTNNFTKVKISITIVYKTDILKLNGALAIVIIINMCHTAFIILLWFYDVVRIN